MPYNLIVFLGPTASGKTAIAVSFASRWNGEILSADSRQVYRGLDIGSGKDLHLYGDVPYHLIDIASLEEEFSVYHYTRAFERAYGQVVSNGNIPVVCGGSGMYLSAIIQNYQFAEARTTPERIAALQAMDDTTLRNLLGQYQPNLHNTTDLTDRNRLIRALIIAESPPPQEPERTWNALVLGIFPPRDQVKENIARRLKERLNNGLIEEVESLLDEGVSYERLSLLGLEYHYVASYLTGKLNYNDMHQQLRSAIIQFAKRQMTWYRKMEKEGVTIHHIQSANDPLLEELMLQKEQFHFA